MGCDIHIYTEEKRHIDGQEVWVSADLYKKNPCFYSEYNEGESEYEICQFYRGRNYGLFALLADVRNYDDIKPISEPRGLPDDICEEIKKEYEMCGCDAHSMSWFLLSELKNVDWSQVAFIKDWLFALEVLEKRLDRDEDKVRLVFWFDN